MSRKPKHNIVVVGYSGHGFVVTEAALASGLSVKFYADKSGKNTNPFNLEYLGYEADEDFKGWTEKYSFILGIGNNNKREGVARFIEGRGRDIIQVIHPSAEIARKTKLGKGIFIARNVSVNPLVTIGDYVILNTGCIIEHECVIGTASHIAPGAVLAGNVRVGSRCLIGANSIIKQGVMIGDHAVIGAGAVILKDVPDGQTVIGNPGKIQ